MGFISTETSGVGAGPSEELLRRLRGGPGHRTWNFVATTSAKKTAGYGTILGLLERRQLVLPRHPDMLRQLAGMRFEQGERGFVRIEAESPVTHDDVADALMLATVPWVQRKGRVACKLARMAAHGVPDAQVPALDVPVVETGDGMRLYRRPSLQSVNGLEVTLPVGAREVDPVAQRAQAEAGARRAELQAAIRRVQQRRETKEVA